MQLDQRGRALIVLALTMLALPTATQAAGATVEIAGMAYAPSDVTVRAGQSVTWTNTDTAPHNAVARDESWRTPILQTGEEASVTFTAVGQFQYFCSVHPGMIANLTVVEALPATDAAAASSAPAADGPMVPWIPLAAGLLAFVVFWRQRVMSR